MHSIEIVSNWAWSVFANFIFMNPAAASKETLHNFSRLYAWSCLWAKPAGHMQVKPVTSRTGSKL
jgi:hypothetical protein